MMRLRVPTILFGVALLGGLALYVAWPSATIRYRLTLEVETPEGLRSGSGVIQVRYVKAIPFLGVSAAWGATVTGEAVAVDLGPRGVLFALLKEGEDPRSAPEYIVLRAFGFPYGAMPTPVAEGIARIAALRGRTELPIGSLPLLVRFRDLSDPKSVERVDPGNLAPSFGEGVRLTGTHIEITSAPSTNKIKAFLPDFGSGSGYGEWYRTLPYGSPQRIGPEDFRKGIKNGH